MYKLGIDRLSTNQNMAILKKLFVKSVYVCIT